VRRVLAGFPENFYGRVELEFRAGQVRKISTTESIVAPDIVEQHGRAYAKSIAGTTPIQGRDSTTK
jgi:hypothetical protein